MAHDILPFHANPTLWAMATGHFWVHAGQEPPKPETGRLCFGAAAGDGQLTAERMPIIGDLQRQLHGS